MNFVFKPGTELTALSIAGLNANPANTLKQVITFLWQSGKCTYLMNMRRQLKNNN